MYSLRMNRRFVAHHFLTVPDCGEENEWHAHVYGLEVTLEGDDLDANGYLIDIVDFDQKLGELIRRYRNATLNDLPEFEGLNPSIEHFARLLCLALARQISAANVTGLGVRVFEDDIASASFTTPLPLPNAER